MPPPWRRWKYSTGRGKTAGLRLNALWPPWQSPECPLSGNQRRRNVMIRQTFRQESEIKRHSFAKPSLTQKVSRQSGIRVSNQVFLSQRSRCFSFYFCYFFYSKQRKIINSNVFGCVKHYLRKHKKRGLFLSFLSSNGWLLKPSNNDKHLMSIRHSAAIARKSWVKTVKLSCNSWQPFYSLFFRLHCLRIKFYGFRRLVF